MELNNLFKNAKTRVFVILILFIIVAGMAFAFMRMGNKNTILDQPSKVLPPPSSMKSGIGNVAPERYTKLLKEANLESEIQAEKLSISNIPTITNELNADKNARNNADLNSLSGDFSRGGFEQGPFDKDGYNKDGYNRNGFDRNGFNRNGFDKDGYDRNGLDKDGFDRNGVFRGVKPKTEAELLAERLQASRDRAEKERQERERKAEEEKERERLEKERERLDKETAQEIDRLKKNADLERKAYEAAIAQRTKAMQAHGQAVFSSWATVNKQAYTAGVLSKAYDDEAKRLLEQATQTTAQLNQLIQKSNPMGSGRFGTTNISAPIQIIKAGTIAYGVLDTAVNSDEPGPILASIVSGKFKGGKLIGAIEVPKNGEKIILNFTTLSLPKMTTSIKVQVVAIDANTARTALATSVDHHYLLRYGSLFASAFMEGVGKAISQPPGTQQGGQANGSSNIIIQTSSAPTTTPQYTNNEKYVLVPLGKVGEEWGKAVKPFFNTPVSIFVEQGTSLGLLFLSDVELKNDQ